MIWGIINETDLSRRIIHGQMLQFSLRCPKKKTTKHQKSTTGRIKLRNLKPGHYSESVLLFNALFTTDLYSKLLHAGVFPNLSVDLLY